MKIDIKRALALRLSLRPVSDDSGSSKGVGQGLFLLRRINEK